MENTTENNNNSYTVVNFQVQIDTWAYVSRMTQNHRRMTVDMMAFSWNTGLLPDTMCNTCIYCLLKALK